MVEELEDCTVAKLSACEKLVVCTVEELEVCTVEELSFGMRNAWLIAMIAPSPRFPHLRPSIPRSSLSLAPLTSSPLDSARLTEDRQFRLMGRAVALVERDSHVLRRMHQHGMLFPSSRVFPRQHLCESASSCSLQRRPKKCRSSIHPERDLVLASGLSACSYS